MTAIPATPASRTDFFARHGDHAIIVAVPADVADEAVHAVFRECGWPLEHFAEITKENASKKQTRAFKVTFLLRRDMQACAAHLRKHKPWGPEAQVRESGFKDAGGSLHHSAVLSHHKCVALLNHAVGPLAWSNTITDLRRRTAPPIRPRAARADGGVSATELGLFCMAKATLMAGMPADALDEDTEEEVLARLIAEHEDDVFADPPPVDAAVIVPVGDDDAQGDDAALVGEDGDVYGAGGDVDDDGGDGDGGDDARAPAMITSAAPVTTAAAHSAGAAVAAALGATGASAAALRDAAGGSAPSTAAGSGTGGMAMDMDHRVIAIDDGDDDDETGSAGAAASGHWPILAPALDGSSNGSTWLINGVHAIPAPPPGPCCFRSPYVLAQGRSLMPTKKKPVGKHPVQMVGQGTGICIHVRTCITIHNAASDAPGYAQGSAEANGGPAFPTVTSVGAGGCTCCAVPSRERRDAVIAACTVDHDADASRDDGGASLHPYRFGDEDTDEDEEDEDGWEPPPHDHDDRHADPTHGRPVALRTYDDDDDDEEMRILRHAAAAAAVALDDEGGGDGGDDDDVLDSEGSASMRPGAAVAGKPSPAIAVRTAGKCFEAFVEHANVTAGYRVGEGAAAVDTGKSRGKPTPTGTAAAAHLTSKYRETPFTRLQQEEGMPMMRATNDALRAACANIHLLLKSPA